MAEAKPKGRACTVCKKQVLCGQGARHLSCSPVCTKCYQPIASDMPFDGPNHQHCPGTKVVEVDHA